MDPALSAAEVRVLGCLAEKRLTTPDGYPLTLNSLRLACCQKSNRDPVVEMSEKDVLRAFDSLNVNHRLTYRVDMAGSRVPHYGHRIEEALGLAESAIALLTELMLRGPQTAGELRVRAGRMHPFGTVDDVEAVVRELVGREPEPLVVQLPLQPRRKEPRYAHLLAGETEAVGVDVPAFQPEPARVRLEEEDQRVAQLEAAVEELRAELDALREAFAAFKAEFQ